MNRLLACAMLVALTAVAPVSAQDYDPPDEPTYDMPALVEAVKRKKGLRFAGANEVAQGARLIVVNRTNPRTAGPHTFSLVSKSRVPRGKRARNACTDDLAGVCRRIFRAHRIDPKTFEVRRPDVDAGRPGWDKAFGKTGDTWYTQTEGERESRTVTAKPGTQLTLLCAVSPEMTRTLVVVRPSDGNR